MVSNIHPTAVIAPTAKVDESAKVGPYCIVGSAVELGENVELVAHVVVDGRTVIGAHTKIYPFSSIGLPPQDLKYKGEPSELIIGSYNTIREHVTINTGTEGGGMVTRIGDRCLLMVGVHIGHDCQLGSNIVMANNATLAGHVTVEDFVTIGGLSAVHQFVRIGKHAMIGGMSGIEGDVIPYATAMGERASLSGLNLVGMKRRNFTREEIHSLRSAYRMLFSPEGTQEERLADTAKDFASNPTVMEIVNFMQSQSSRSLTQPKIGRSA